VLRIVGIVWLHCVRMIRGLQLLSKGFVGPRVLLRNNGLWVWDYRPISYCE